MFDLALFTKLCIGTLLSAGIGFERQVRGKPVGVRTSVIICVGTIVFVVIGRTIELGAGDPTRVLGQIVTGIGFLGAGVILSREGLIRGMTSAAVIWSLAAIGCAIGYELYSIAVQATGFILFALIGMRKVEGLFDFMRRGVHREEDEKDS